MPDQAYADHIRTIQQRWESALDVAGFGAAIVTAGENAPYFLDDQTPVFRNNPHLAQWFPDDHCELSALLVRPGKPPRLYFYQPTDYWHLPPEKPDWVSGALEVQLYNDAAKLEAAILGDSEKINRVAHIGEHNSANLPTENSNPAILLNHLHYHRAYKTPWEIACMTRATEQAIKGHLAARDVFYEGGSEFDINLAYLAASEQTSADLPYSNIIALNEHAGVLHYQHYDRNPPEKHLSFLIDAGGRDHNYASDITRTYSADEQGLFAQLLGAVDEAQQAIIEGIRPGPSYLDLHEQFHQRLAVILCDLNILRCSATAAFETGLTRSFLPHGLGHLIGLQTHDVGGLQSSAEGGMTPPPEHYPALRLTRPVEAGQVFTIEPGVYFIPILLDALRNDPNATEVNWDAVDELRPCGGIRIEDNVLVTEDGAINLTRDAFLSA
ncbi:MAG: Xaa-Pro dipeptidase [Gammaproteobacteria bacterium]|nr:Xaa-Pro dipeptidase [Gammaproteobacteria bacterium]